MTWILVTRKPHICQWPPLGAHNMNDHWKGSIWKCDDCERRWEITGWATSGGWGDSHPQWKDVTHRSAEV